MAVQVINRPNDRCWSGNPMPYKLYSPEAAADDTIFFEIQVWFKRRDQADFSNITTLNYNPYNGVANIDVKEVIQALLEYEIPYCTPSAGIESLYFANKATGHFYIKYRQISTATPDPAWSTESASERFCIKGGISFNKWRGDNYWVNYFDVVKPFLTWQKSGRQAFLNERMYIAFLNLTDIFPGDIKMRRKVVYIDNSEYIDVIDLPVNKYDVVYFPAGIKQLKLDEIDAAKKIYYWELQVWDHSAAPVLYSEAFRFYLDNRPDNKAVTLNYRNSIAGFDSVRVTGVIEDTLQREFTEIGRPVLYNYFTNHYIEGRSRIVNSKESLVHKGDIGHLSKEMQDRLRDIHYQREVWIEQDAKWIPVLALTGSNKLKSTDDKRWTMPIEWTIADDGDEWYTPASVNLQEGNIPTVPACNAVISPLSYSEPGGGGYLIDWSLVSGSPGKYFISTPGVSGGAPHESLTTDYLFDWLPDGDNVITVTPLCLVGTDWVFGASQQITVTVGTVCTPVSFPTGSALPDAEVAVTYSHTIALNGTAPFALGTVSKPSWMTVAISGSDLVFGGLPEPGDETAAVVISVQVTNCSGASATFVDTIAVEEQVTGFPFLARYDSTEVGVCMAVDVEYYLAPPHTTLAVGFVVYSDAAMTMPLGDGYIVAESGGNIFSMIGGMITADTGNVC